MGTFKALVSCYALTTALLAAVYRVTIPLYGDSAPPWLDDTLHWVMALGVILALLANFLYWYRKDNGLSVGVTFYSSFTLAVLFFWVWGCSTFSDSEISHIAHAVWWPPVDALYAVVGIALARRLWKER